RLPDTPCIPPVNKIITVKTESAPTPNASKIKASLLENTIPKWLKKPPTSKTAITYNGTGSLIPKCSKKTLRKFPTIAELLKAKVTYVKINNHPEIKPILSPKAFEL